MNFMNHSNTTSLKAVKPSMCGEYINAPLNTGGSVIH